MTATQKKANPKMAHCDLRLRLIDDGSELFSRIASLPSNAAKNIRASQLMYLGMLVESGRLFAGMQIIHGMPSANDAHVKEPSKVPKAAPKPVEAAVEIPAAAPAPVEVMVHPDDLAQFFPPQ